jgi:predicted transcriptional regulator
MVLETLSPIEGEIYNLLTNRYLKRHREINLQILLPFCFKHLNKDFSPNLITEALHNLISKHYLIKGSSLSRDDILNNPVRKNLLQFIRINPGCYNRQIRRELNIGSNEFNWHIGMLEKFGLVKRVQFDRSFGFYESRQFMGHEYDLYLLQNEKVQKILDYLHKKRGTLSQIAKLLDMHYSTVQKYLEILTERQLLKSKMYAKHIFYESNEELLLKLRKIVNGAIFVEFA